MPFRGRRIGLACLTPNAPWRQLPQFVAIKRNTAGLLVFFPITFLLSLRSIYWFNSQSNRTYFRFILICRMELLVCFWQLKMDTRKLSLLSSPLPTQQKTVPLCWLKRWSIFDAWMELLLSTCLHKWASIMWFVSCWVPGRIQTSLET